MNLLGIHAFYYNHSAALLCDGTLKFFLENEKLNRIKGARDGFPIEAVKTALKLQQFSLDDIDEIVYAKMPFRYALTVFKQGLQSLFNFFSKSEGPSLLPDRVIIALHEMPFFLNNLIAQNLKFSSLSGKIPPIHFVPHHLAHAASVFYTSGMEQATIVVVDGMGETESTTIWKGEGLKLTKLAQIPFPNSLGEFYAAFTEFCGFKTYQQEGKLMGLAPYGQIDGEIYAKMEHIIQITEKKYRIFPKYTIHGNHSYGLCFSDIFVDLFGPPRSSQGEISQYYKNIAYAAQDLLEKATLEVIKNALAITGIKNLCFSGGVAMNCKLNGFIEQSGIIDKFFVLPAANDAGAALGATMVRAVEKGKDPRFELQNTYYGLDFSDLEIEKVLREIKIPYNKIDLQNLDDIVDLLIAQKVIGLFTMKSEFGARALGARSILADPRTKDMTDIVNTRVKRREPWRPFAPVIIEGFEEEFFENGRISKYMMKAYRVKPDKRELIPAVVHIDGTCRPQSINHDTNPTYFNILQSFYQKTNVPVLLNTSFNVRGEPIVNSPIDALRCYLSTGMDALLIGSFLLVKS